jgi:hypothetical protein
MFFRRKKVINFREPAHVENPLISFQWNKVLIETDDGSILTVEEKPKKKRKKESEDED